MPRDAGRHLSALDAARASGLVRAGESLLVMLSGGADSVCLLGVAAELGARVSALHVNYGLRGADSDADEAHCAAVCERLGIPLASERVTLPPEGNLQSAARDARYALAEALAEGDYAAAHTASDQAETVLYRLASSPGRRALLGMEARRGRLVRPLLAATREGTEAWCSAAGLQWREDISNADARFARVRVRESLLPAMREIAPAAEQNVVETARQLRDESEVLDAAVAEAVARLGPAVELEALRREPPALARLVVRRLAEGAAGGPLPLSAGAAARVLALGGQGTQELDLGGGVRAIAEYGVLRFSAAGPAAVPDPVLLTIPGAARFGAWEVVARLDGRGEVSLSREALGSAATVRGWREGDRMRPAGLGGSKTLSDLFTDAKVPRALRASLPVVEANGDIAWVAGVAAGESFIAREGDPAASLSARRSPA